MEIIERYLDQVLRYTFLSKREKSEWREEMAFCCIFISSLHE